MLLQEEAKSKVELSKITLNSSVGATAKIFKESLGGDQQNELTETLTDFIHIQMI